MSGAKAGGQFGKRLSLHGSPEPTSPLGVAPSPATERSRMPNQSRLGWKGYLTLALIGMAAQLLVPAAAAKPIIYRIVATASVVLTWLAIRWNRPEDALPWRLLATGTLMFLIGDYLLYYETIIRDVDRAFPGVPDIFYLANFPFVAVGLLLLIRRREPGGDRASLIDATLIAIAIALVSWVYLIAPNFVHADLPLLDRAVGMAYPLVDVVLLAIAARLALGRGSRRPDHVLLMAAIGSLVLADVLFTLQDLLPGSAISTVHFYDVGWMAYYSLVAVATLHPSMRIQPDRTEGVELKASRRRLVVLAAFVLVAPAVLAIQSARRDYRDISVVVLASVALFVLVMVRMSGLMQRLQRLRDVERDHAAQLETLNFRLDSALQASLEEVSRQAEDLQESRGRLVTASDTARRQIERNLHDGAQQHLMALAVDLQMARRLAQTDPEGTVELLDRLEAALRTAVNELRILAHGIFPPLLADRGLREALAATADLIRIPVRIEARDLGGVTLQRSRPRSISAVLRPCRTLESTPAQGPRPR